MYQEEIEKYRQEGVEMIPRPLHFRISQAQESLMEGLKFVMRHKVDWLKEYDEIADWLSDNKEKGLFLIGPVGVGKTEICMKVLPLMFRHALKLILTRMSAIDLNVPDRYKAAKSHKLLVVDDVGTESPYNDYGTVHDVFSEVVDGIEKNGVLLIATSNLSDEELETKYGARTMDRIKANMRIVIFDENSLRGKFAKEL